MHIDDLAHPRFSPEVEEVRALQASMAPELRLEPDALLDAASTATGLSDFGDEQLRERLGVLCTALRTEAGLGPVGIVASYVRLTHLLKNRLLVEDVLLRHPEIHDERIERPIIICGLPRAGTTHLHNLIATDTAIRSLPFWEGVEPVLPEHEQPALGAPDPRRTRAEAGLAYLDTALPYLKRMRELTVDCADEEYGLLAMAFSTWLFEPASVLSTWRDWCTVRDQKPAYEYLRTLLRVLQWQRGGTRWVLKSPYHIEQLPVLRDTFPDATFVVMHRDPVAITASLSTTVCYVARLNLERVDPVKIGQHWADRLEEWLRACVEDRDVLPAQQSIDVHFAEFMADEIATVERIYELAGQPMTVDGRVAMQAFADQHPRGGHGRVRYVLSDFGLEKSERRDALKFYVDRFGVAEE